MILFVYSNSSMQHWKTATPTIAENLIFGSVREIAAKPKDKGFRFYVDFENRTYLLVADNEDEKNEWTRVLDYEITLSRKRAERYSNKVKYNTLTIF